MSIQEEIIANFILYEKSFQEGEVTSFQDNQQIDTFNEISEMLSSKGIKIKRNIPFRYLVKLADKKISKNRYLNIYSNKILQFPPKDAFQIYILNILVYSKLETCQLPTPYLINLIAIQIIDQYHSDPLLSQFQQLKFYDQSWQPKIIKKSLCSCISPYLQKTNKYTINDIKTAFKQFLSCKNNGSKYDMVPYSYFNKIHKKHIISSIYLPTTLEKSAKSKNTAKKYYSTHRALTKTPTRISKTPPKLESKLFIGKSLNFNYKDKLYISQNKNIQSTKKSLKKYDDIKSHNKNSSILIYSDLLSSNILEQLIIPDKKHNDIIIYPSVIREQSHHSIKYLKAESEQSISINQKQNSHPDNRKSKKQQLINYQNINGKLCKSILISQKSLTSKKKKCKQ